MQFARFRSFSERGGLRSTVVLAAFASLAALLGGATARGAAPDGTAESAPRKGPSRKWALLIGVEKYHRASRLRYTVNDVTHLAETLRTRGDYDSDDIVTIDDKEPNPRFQPFRTSLQAEIPALLAKPGPDDYVLVYFSGHGFKVQKDKQEKLYLAPIDCDPARAAETGIAVEWFREQLAKCPAKTKLLILDACHSGNEKGDDDSADVAAKDLGTPFRELEGVVTLASSTSNERSLIWEDQEQSLFSYWLNQGLRGRADENGDGDVTIDELYNYVYRNVTKTAKLRFPKPQTPVRIVRSGTLGVPVVVHLKPQPLRVLLTDVGEQLAWSMELAGLPKVGVLEFTADTKWGERLGGDFGLLGRYCAEEVERCLTSRAGDKFKVVDGRRVQTAIKAMPRFGLQELGSPDAMKGLSVQAGGMPAIVVGTLRNRAGQVVTLQCKMEQTEGDEMIASAGGIATLNESEWAMLGRSVQVDPVVDRRPVLGSASTEASTIHNLDRRSRTERHPLSKPSFPYVVKVMVRGSGELPDQRPFTFLGDQCYVDLRQDEVYELWIENKTADVTPMRLLVDGLNTLPEPPVHKGVAVEAAPPGPAAEEPEVMGMRVNLDEARHWIIPARTEVAVRGFFSKVGDETADFRRFTVSDAKTSLAGRQNFTDQLGLITIAFYNSKPVPRSVIGTRAGEAGSEAIHGANNRTAVGPMRACVTIHYVDPDTLESLKRQGPDPAGQR